jgi:predicted dehydrogenase
VAKRPPLRVGIVGCGNIAGPYARDIEKAANLRLVGATDLDPARAEALVGRHGGRAYATLDELLAADEVDLVVNLTFQSEHARVSRAALEAGKHVHSEKPLALSAEEAWGLVELARARGLRLGCSPFTLMGEAQQTAWKTIRDGRVGQVRAVFCEVDWGRIESWHPAPQPFYEVGPVSDVGIYPMSITTAMFGPVRRVQAFGRVLAPDRVTKDGVAYRVTTPDLQILVLELESGVVVRLTANFYAGRPAHDPASLVFHGDTGSVWVETFMRLDCGVAAGTLGDDEYEPVPLVRAAPAEMDWARALSDLADAIADDRPHRATGDQAAHLVDVLDAARASMAADGRAVEVTSSFPVVAPMPWAT